MNITKMDLLKKRCVIGMASYMVSMLIIMKMVNLEKILFIFIKLHGSYFEYSENGNFVIYKNLIFLFFNEHYSHIFIWIPYIKVGYCKKININMEKNMEIRRKKN